MQSVTAEELRTLVSQYRKRFGAGSPTWESTLHTREETASRVRKALETGVPIHGWEPGEETSLKGERHAPVEAPDQGPDSETRAWQQHLGTNAARGRPRG